MSRARVALRLAGYAAVLVFLGWQIWRVRHGMVDSLRAVGWAAALAAGVLAAVGGVPGFVGWRVLLAGLGTRLSLRDATRVYFLAGLTRYLPGGVWPTVAHAAMARPLRQPPTRLAAAFLASQGLAAVSGVLVGVLALPWLLAQSPWWWLLLPACAAAAAPVLAPDLLARLLGAAARLLRRGDAGPLLPGRRALLGATGLMVLGWLISGLHVTVLAVALGADPGPALPLGVGGFALSVVAGLCAVVLPTGLGVREVALALTVATLVSGPDLVTLVALSRVLLTVGDIGSTAVVLALLAATGRRAGPPDPPTASRPHPTADRRRLEGSPS
ncbi:lysylphosphatidylglycerol synthase domain-containing protein [Micromonospora yasonensis]|uniref:lysylphosphatidylglycerol synthase domain-containing protein n=1 Tax=Micromonospora yasonensis TaxID=1128667 RepID=UPI00222EEFE4|nr:lysylphosphatidylglycerol synthase domain-containing protein [Micromonospora yasonensis]MCW3840457.1 lysylphosphatidylglycerol synthase domain-containing protein [Micromonospora yasonensis]